MDEHIAQTIEKTLGYCFRNRELLEQAFTHRSYANIQKSIQHNERLEFLGDSVLGLGIAEDLYRRFPEETEGALSKIKAFMVHSDVLASITGKLDLQRYLLVEKGEKEIQNNRKIKENLLEAVIGAVYLDGGILAAETLIKSLFNQADYLIMFCLSGRDPCMMRFSSWKCVFKVSHWPQLRADPRKRRIRTALQGCWSKLIMGKT